MDIILNGILAGLIISILPGPIMFGLIELAIDRSTKAAIIYASGVWLSDLLYISVIQHGFSHLSESIRFKLLFGLIGAIILIVFGIGTFFSPIVKRKIKSDGIKTWAGYFFKGVAINVFNPFVFLIWIGLLSNVGYESTDIQWRFAGSLLLVVAITDIIKSYSANKIGSFLTDKNLKILKQVTGSLLGIFGIVLLVRTLISL